MLYPIELRAQKPALTCGFVSTSRGETLALRFYSVEFWGAVNQRAPTIGDLAPLIRSWKLHLAAANLSPRTIQSHTGGPPPAAPVRTSTSTAKCVR